jgi:hypothetical protein
MISRQARRARLTPYLRGFRGGYNRPRIAQTIKTGFLDVAVQYAGVQMQQLVSLLNCLQKMRVVLRNMQLTGGLY